MSNGRLFQVECAKFRKVVLKLSDGISIYLFFWFYIVFNSQGYIATGSVWVEEPMHPNWSRFCSVNH